MSDKNIMSTENSNSTDNDSSSEDGYPFGLPICRQAYVVLSDYFDGRILINEYNLHRYSRRRIEGIYTSENIALAHIRIANTAKLRACKLSSIDYESLEKICSQMDNHQNPSQFIRDLKEICPEFYKLCKKCKLLSFIACRYIVSFTAENMINTIINEYKLIPLHTFAVKVVPINAPIAIN